MSKSAAERHHETIAHGTEAGPRPGFPRTKPASETYLEVLHQPGSGYSDPVSPAREFDSRVEQRARCLLSEVRAEKAAGRTDAEKYMDVYRVALERAKRQLVSEDAEARIQARKEANEES